MYPLILFYFIIHPLRLITLLTALLIYQLSLFFKTHSIFAVHFLHRAVFSIPHNRPCTY